MNAPVGTRIEGGGATYTVAPACPSDRRYWYCLMHGETFPDRAQLAPHLAGHRRGRLPCVLAYLCCMHGPEAIEAL